MDTVASPALPIHPLIQDLLATQVSTTVPVLAATPTVKAKRAPARKATVVSLTQKEQLKELEIQLQSVEHLVADTRTAAAQAAGLDKLLQIQTSWLRRLLQVGRRSLRIVVFTELNLIPLHTRRLLLALRYLRYGTATSAPVLVAASMRAFNSLAELPSPRGWYYHLRCALATCVPPINLPPLDELTTDFIINLEKTVLSSALRLITEEVTRTRRLYFLHGRLDFDADGEKPAYHPLFLRQYLHVTVPRFRKSLTRVLLSCSTLAIDVLRVRQMGRLTYHRDKRLCRLCRGDTEDIVHILLHCPFADLIPLRSAFFIDIGNCSPVLTMWREPLHLFQLLVTHPNTVDHTARCEYVRALCT